MKINTNQKNNWLTKLQLIQNNDTTTTTAI